MKPDPAFSLPTLGAILLTALLPSAVPAGYDPRRIGWSELHFEAAKLGFRIESRLEIRRLSPGEMNAALIDPGPGAWLKAPVGGGWLVNLDTSGLGKHSRLDLILDAHGRSLQRTQVETGRRLKDNRDRTLRFAPGAVHVGTRRPTRDEVGRPSTEWSDRSEWLQELSPELVGDAVLGQATGLFYTLAAAELLERGDRVTTHVLSKGRVMEVDLVVEARERLEVDFVEAGPAGERLRHETIDTLRVRLSGMGVEDDVDDSDFRFLGMRGEIDVHLDPTTRAPVQISGRVGWLGRAKVRLQRLVLGRH